VRPHPRRRGHSRKGAVERRSVDVEESGDLPHRLALVEELTGVVLLLRRQFGLPSKLYPAASGDLHTGRVPIFPVNR